MKNVLVTCPPMIGMLNEFRSYANSLNIKLTSVNTTQVLSEAELISLLPNFDGWIIGDDPATYKVFEAGKKGKLKAAVKWGIGVDNVDFDACTKLNIPITNTPNMFGGEVADLAMSYLLDLFRHTTVIDREIRTKFLWPKYPGMSVEGKTVGVVGYGDIGKNLVQRLVGFNTNIIVYDPFIIKNKNSNNINFFDFPKMLEHLDVLILTCSLNESNHHLLNEKTIKLLKKGSFLINVSRGPLIDECALIDALNSKHLSAVALDVYETEPLPNNSKLRDFSNCIFGSHNGSNTLEGVNRASIKALDEMSKFLG